MDQPTRWSLALPEKLATIRADHGVLSARMNYQEAIAYLHSLTDFEKTRIERYSAEMFDLARVRRLLASVGDPQTQFPSVHIAGTKGKGSTAAMLAACLQSAGHRTGLYTSPHLHTFRERIQVNGAMVSRDELVRLVEGVRAVRDDNPAITTFEATTAIAFQYFRDHNVDIAVVEVGLGGRLDATNILNPEVSVITSLSLDHTYILGDTLDAIAREKGGIIKHGTPVVIAPQREKADRELEGISRDRDAPLTKVGRDWTWRQTAYDLAGQSFRVHRADGTEPDFEQDYWIPLLGKHQLENATSAVAVMDVLRDRGVEVSVDAVRKGLRAVTWPGRMQILSQAPLVVADCAHNPYSSQVLRQALTDWFPGRRWLLLFGASVDKDVPGMLRPFLPDAAHIIVTRSDHPRAASPVALADTVAGLGAGAEIAVSVKRALERGLSVVGPGDGVLITGSIFLVAEAIRATDQTGPDRCRDRAAVT
jgi:dihydrofolate synthase/folylpolyglutamate synthase